MIRRSDITVADALNTPEPGVYVTVKDSLGNVAPIFDDLGAAKANPFASDATTGAFYYNVQTPGTYTEEFRLSLGNSPAKVDVVSLQNSTDSSLINFLGSWVGGVVRTLLAKLMDIPSVKDFGVVGDGSDETTKIQAAFNSGASRIFFPKGNYGWTALNIPANVDMLGAGLGTTLVPLDNASNFVTLNGGSKVQSCQVLPATQRTGGCYFKLNGGDNVIRDVKKSLGYKLIDISGSAGIAWIERCHWRDNNNNGASELVLVNTAGGAVIFERNLADNSGAMPLACIRIRACQSVRLSLNNIIHCGTDLLIDPPTGSTVATVRAAHNFFDTATKGISIKPSGGNVVRSGFFDCWTSSHTSHGFEIDLSGGGTLDGVEIVAPQAHLNGGDGIHLQSGINVDVIGGEAAGNTGSGFFAAATASAFTVRRFHAGATDGLAGNAYGINISVGASDYDVDDNICTGNTTANITGAVPTIASAANLVLPTRGKTFNISGTTNITNLSAESGRIVTLVFQGVLTITSSTGATNDIRLAGGTNFTTAAGSTLTLRHNGAQWYEIARAA